MAELDDELARFRTFAFLVRRAKERALDAPYDQYVLDLGIPALGKKRVDKRTTTAAFEEYFDSVEATLFEQYLLRMVATFERLAFEKVAAAVGGSANDDGRELSGNRALCSCRQTFREGCRRRPYEPFGYRKASCELPASCLQGFAGAA